jgi:hypothetical protein
MIRPAIALSTLLLSSVTFGQTVYCPASPQPFWEDDDKVNPLDLIWDLDDGGTAKVQPGDVAEILFAKYSGTEVSCQIDATVSYYNSNGEMVAQDYASLDSDDSLVAVERQFYTEQTLIIDVQGTASGCSKQDLRSFSVNIGTLREANEDVTPFSQVGFGSFLVKQRQARKPVFRRLLAADGYDGMGKAGAVLQLACPGGGNPQPFYADDGVNPLDLIWDLDDGGSSEASTEETELLIFVTPRVLTEPCRRQAVDFMPKVKIEVIVTDQDENEFTLLGEIDADHPIASFTFPSINGGRKQHHFSVRARSPACIAERGGSVGAGVRVGVLDSGVDYDVWSQSFPMTVRRVPAQPIPDRDIVE